MNATERQLQYRLRTYRVLIQVIRRNSPDYVLLPAELKHLGLILYLFVLKHVCRFQLVTYTHSHVAWNWPPWLSVPLTKFVFALHDKIIFYTDQAKMTCLRERLVAPEKAFSANNTLDTDSIWQSYTFEINRSPGKRVLFIGRLMANKDRSSLFEYFAELRKHGVGLTIIGDGPERERVRTSGIHFTAQPSASPAMKSAPAEFAKPLPWPFKPGPILLWVSDYIIVTM